jgi:hypothetical protein
MFRFNPVVFGYSFLVYTTGIITSISLETINGSFAFNA